MSTQQAATRQQDSAVFTAHHMDLTLIERISRFRSAAGHDYSDDFESCRSMKHYFQPRRNVDWSQLAIYAPAEGRIEHIRDEKFKGQQLTLQPNADPQLRIILFHIAPSVHIGQQVRAGQRIGTHASRETFSDVAVVSLDSSTDRRRFISMFTLLSPELIDDYRRLGVDPIDRLIISRAERDQHPLHCTEHGDFEGRSMDLPDWIELEQGTQFQDLPKYLNTHIKQDPQ